jgi:hypothetical protein
VELLILEFLFSFEFDKIVKIPSSLIKFPLGLFPMILLIIFPLLNFFLHKLQFNLKPNILFLKPGNMFPQRLLIPSLSFHLGILLFLLMRLFL